MTQNKTLAITLLGIGLLIAGCVNGQSNEYNGKSKERESTIDSCWQQKADSLLRNAIRGDKRIKEACIAVMNVWSGNVPVMVNLSRNESANEYYNFASGSLLEAYKNIPGHYVVALRSFLPEDDWNTIEVEGPKHVEMPDPKSPEWSESVVYDRSKGYSMKVSPLHVMTFYGALASGNIVGAHLILGTGRDVPLSRYGKIDRSMIINALGCSNEDSLVGMASVSRFNEYGNSSRAGETFAGFFPKDEPEYAVVCAIFTDRPYSGYKMTGAAQKVAEKLSGLISAGMVGEKFQDDWRNISN